MIEVPNELKYRLWAPVYDGLIKLGYVRDARRRSLSSLELKEGDKVLLVGVGTGEDLVMLPENVHAIGVDITLSMLRKAILKAPDNADLLLMDGSKLGFKDGSFDAVVLSLVVAVVDRPKELLDESVRVLRPGGQIIIFDKFLKGERPGTARRMLDVGLRLIATGINVRAEDIIDTAKVDVVMDVPSIMFGNFRTLLLRKKVTI